MPALRSKTLTSITLFTLGLMLGGAGWWYGDGPWQLASARVADERYEQRPACRAGRVALHRVLHLRFTAPRDAMRRARAIRVDDPLRPEPLALAIAPGPDGADQGGSVIYQNLFGKAEHRESWRPFCEGERCAPSLNYHPPDRDQAAAPREIGLYLLDEQGTMLFHTRVRDVPVTLDSGGLANGINWPPIFITKDRQIVVPAAINHDLDVVLQTRQHDGPRVEKNWLLAARAQPLRIAVPDVAYAGVYVARLEGMRQHLMENKIELANDADPFMRCPAGDSAGATGAAPATPSRQMPTPDAPPKPE